MVFSCTGKISAFHRILAQDRALSLHRGFGQVWQEHVGEELGAVVGSHSPISGLCEEVLSVHVAKITFAQNLALKNSPHFLP